MLFGKTSQPLCLRLEYQAQAKQSFFNNLLGGLLIVRIDLDEIVKEFPGYTPEKYYEFREAANIVLDEMFRYCRHHRLDFALDGTFAHQKTLDNIEKSLRSHEVVIFYMWQDPIKAWQLTKDREIVEHRAISREGFIKACLTIPENLKAVRERFSDIPVTAIKRTNDNVGFDVLRIPSEIDQLLDRVYTKEELEKIII